jgi:RNA polymerase sigma factor (TIGR02999 family)
MNDSGTPEAGITAMLDALEVGDVQAAGELFSRVYQELRRLAAWRMAAEAPGHTLQPTALVHEAWLRLFGGKTPHWNNRAHFFEAAGKAMRRILVESARRKKRLKRGGQLERVEMDEANLSCPMPDQDLLALNEALDRLGEADPRAVEVVNLCFFVGLTHEQAARELGVSLSTIERTWAFARAWLFRELERSKGLAV